jgi:hypothetical protein
MSARDDLTRFDTDWNHHLQWRKGAPRMLGEKDSPGVYAVKQGSSATWSSTVTLSDLPEKVRTRVEAALNDMVKDLVDRIQKQVRADLIHAARDEAERTLAELSQDGAET